MTEYTRYIADDGTEFDDYEECVDYEKKLEMDELKEEVIALDKDGKPVDDFRDVDEIFYLCISSNDAAHQLDDLWDTGWPWSSDSTRCVAFPKAGRFLYDIDADRWIDIDDIKEKIKEAEYYIEGAQ